MTDAPNLDCMPDGELMTFWAKHQNGRAYRLLFPQGGKGTKRAAADLANYASNLATARSCRGRGDIVTAQMYEGVCERIYTGLPTFARW
jgi:hypothetical protein